MKHNKQPVSLDQMAERFRREIFAYIQTRVGERAAAEDLTQETFLKVQNSLSKGTEAEHFRGRELSCRNLGKGADLHE